MLFVRLLLICFLVASAAWAEQEGVLSGLRPGQVSFLVGDQVRSYRITPEQHRALGRQGLGARGQLWSDQDQFRSFVASGVDREIGEALQLLRRFAAAVWEKRLAQAFQMTLPDSRQVGSGPFLQFWSQNFLSSDPLDWSITSLKENVVVVSVFSVAIEGWDEDVETTVRHYSLRLRKHNFRWWVESYR